MRKVWPWLAGLIVFLVLGWIILFGAGFFKIGVIYQILASFNKVLHPIIGITMVLV